MARSVQRQGAAMVGKVERPKPMTTNRNNLPGGLKIRIRNGGVLMGAAILIMGAFEVPGDVQRWDVLTTTKASYTNVTITGKSGNNVFIRHGGGMANIKADDLGDEARQALGYVPFQSGKKRASQEKAAVTRSVLGVIDTISVEKLRSLTSLKFAANAPEIRLNSSLVAGLLTGFLLGYLFLCYCFALICRKAGHEPGALVWMPVFQLIPLLRAAGMSGWWFLAFFLPVLSLVAHILWSVNIVRARDKSVWWAVLMILPLTNLLAILYLAFSGTGSSDSTPRVQVATPQPA
jgi:hypothetical protein